MDPNSVAALSTAAMVARAVAYELTPADMPKGVLATSRVNAAIEQMTLDIGRAVEASMRTFTAALDHIIASSKRPTAAAAANRRHVPAYVPPPAAPTSSGWIPRPSRQYSESPPPPSVAQRQAAWDPPSSQRLLPPAAERPTPQSLHLRPLSQLAPEPPPPARPPFRFPILSPSDLADYEDPVPASQEEIPATLPEEEGLEDRKPWVSPPSPEIDRRAKRRFVDLTTPDELDPDLAAEPDPALARTLKRLRYLEPPKDSRRR